MSSKTQGREISKEYFDIIRYLIQNDFQNVLSTIDKWESGLEFAEQRQLIKAFASLKMNDLQTARNSCANLIETISPEELAQYLQAELDHLLKPFNQNRPKVINFQVNDRCNSRCLMCNIWKQQDRNEITVDDFTRLISHPFFSEVEGIGITGGEPTLRSDLVDFYKAAVHTFPRLQSGSFITNGFLVEKAINDYVEVNQYYRDRQLIFSGMVSIDGVGVVHDRVRGVPGAFLKSCRTLFGLLHRGVQTNACCTIIKENVYDLQNLLSWGKDNGVYIRFRIGEFINRLYNLDCVDQIRNFSDKEIQHLISFFSLLTESYETDPVIRRTYSSILSILSGGKRLIQCPYQTNSAINVNSKGQFSFCAPKGLVHSFGSDPEAATNEYRSERLAIQAQDCPDCIHDYHSIDLPRMVLDKNNKDRVKAQIYSCPPERLEEFETSTQPIAWHEFNTVLLTGWYGTETAGDIAILAGILMEYLEKNPALQFKLLSLFPAYTKKSLISLPAELLTRLEIADFWGHDVRKYVVSCDAIVMAGGPLMDIPYTYEISCLFKNFVEQGKPCIIEGCGIGPLHNQQFRQNVVNMVRMAAYISVRDAASRELLRTYGINKEILVRPDPSITYVRSCVIQSFPDENIIRCYLRELTGEYKQKISPVEAENRIVAFLRSLADWFPNDQIELWAMHYFPVGKDDRQFNALIAAKLANERIHVVVEPKSPKEIIASMKTAAFCVSMRFHSVVFARSIGAKFIAIDYTDGGKIAGYLKDNHHLARMVSLENLPALSREDFLAMANNHVAGEKPVKPLSVVQISTYAAGGAGSAAQRLNDALNLTGSCASSMLVRFQSANARQTFLSSIDSQDNLKAELLTQVLQTSGINENRTERSNTLFSLPVFGFNLLDEPAVKAADIINLHWVSFFQSPQTLKNLSNLKKPVIWTLHDEWAFTGGCHYRSGCDHFKQDCSSCPQVLPAINDFSAAFLTMKREMLDQLSPVIVTPSHWLASVVRQSALMKNLRVEVIPNSVDIDVFRPIEKGAARVQLGLNPEGIYFLFGAEAGVEKRKGYAAFVEALRICQQNQSFSKRLENGKVVFLAFGTPAVDMTPPDLLIKNMGYVQSEQQLSLIYNAADFFILPSLEDNLPNTILEALGCGTPVIAFNTGGVPEMIEPGMTGFLAETGDIAELAHLILEAAQLPQTTLLGLRKNARDAAVKKFSFAVQAKRYHDLYQDVLTRYVPGQTIENQTSISGSSFLDLELIPRLKQFYYDALERFAINREIAYRESEADRAARLTVIREKEAEVINLNEKLLISEQDRAARWEQILQYKDWLEEAEKDRAARWEQILQYKAWLEEAEQDRRALRAQIEAAEVLQNQLSSQLTSLSSTRRAHEPSFFKRMKKNFRRGK